MRSFVIGAAITVGVILITGQDITDPSQNVLEAALAFGFAAYLFNRGVLRTLRS